VRTTIGLILPGRWRRDRRGVAAIEFAMALPLLILLLMGVVELGLAYAQAMQVRDAAAAGALYAGRNGWDAAAIAAAVAGTGATSGVSASPAPLLYCGCPDAAGVAPTTCGYTCGDGRLTRQYVDVSASVARRSVFPGAFGMPATLTATATARLP
jgi:hypothetical protein